MCEAAGVSLENAVGRKRLSSSERHVMVVRCGHCKNGEACRLWRLGSDIAVSEFPGYCLNAEIIETLAGAE